MLRLLAVRFATPCTRYASTVAINSQHDYIVVGAGSAGCVLTHRLTQAGKDVCLLEAGPVDEDPRIHTPLGWFALHYDKTLNWNYWTTEQENAGGRQLYCPRGKAVGGSSSINATIYMRPNPQDLDRWAFQENAYGWSSADCLPYFKKLETYHPSDDYPADQLHKYRGSTGPLHVTGGKLRNKDSQLDLCSTFIEAAQQFGLAYTHDMNGYRQEGTGWFDTTYYQGLRISTANTYLKLAQQCETQASRLHLHTHSLVTRLLFDQSKQRVVGVETADVNDRTKLRRHYAKEVILSGGSINSPQILQLSGIGNAQELKQVGVEPVVNLPGVGQNLQDHLRVGVDFECTSQKVSQLRKTEVEKRERHQWMTSKTGLLTTSALECGAHIRTASDYEYPNVQINFSPFTIDNVTNEKFETSATPAYGVHAAPHRPQSRGFIKLRCSDPFEHPVIDPKVLTDQRDVKEYVDAVKVCLQIGQQKAFDSVRKRVIGLEADADDKQIEQYVRNSCGTSYHPLGTCKMGDIAKDANTVVDARSMRVYGVDGLRVVDASVMPSEPSCNVNSPTIMIAERASDLILGKKLMTPEDVPFYKST